MKILLIFLLLGLFLKAIKVLFSYVVGHAHDFKGNSFLTRSSASDYVNSFSPVSDEITLKGAAVVAPLPTKPPLAFPTLVLLQSGIVDTLGKQSIAQAPLKLSA